MRVVDCFTRTTRRTERVKKFDICLVKLPSLEEGNLVFGGMHPAIIVSNDTSLYSASSGLSISAFANDTFDRLIKF